MPIKVSYEDIVPGDPPEEEEGRLFYDSYDRVLKYWNGFEWIFLGTSIGGYCGFDNGHGRCWPWAIRVGIMSATSEDAQYKVVIDEEYVKVYAVDGTLKTQGAVAADFWDKVKEDGSDIRVFDQAKEQLYFWVEEWDYTGRNAVIWVKLPAGSTELNIAYGNPSATKSGYENGEQVFEFFDDFATFDTNVWKIMDGRESYTTVETTEKGIRVTTSDAWGGIETVDTFSMADRVLEFKVKINKVGASRYSLGFKDNTVGIGTAFKNTAWSVEEDWTDEASESATTPTNTWETVRLISQSGGTYKGQVSWSTTTLQNTTSQTTLPIGVVLGSGGYDIEIDNVKVLKLADPAEFEEPEIITLTE